MGDVVNFPVDPLAEARFYLQKSRDLLPRRPADTEEDAADPASDLITPFLMRQAEMRVLRFRLFPASPEQSTVKTPDGAFSSNRRRSPINE
jgi:hypothetical protein